MNEIFFKYVVWKKEDESFHKTAVLGFGFRIEPRSSCNKGMCATNAPQNKIKVNIKKEQRL